MSPAILDETVLHAGWARFLKLRVRLADGTTIAREVEDHGSAACVLAYDETRRVAVLVSQFRPAVFRETGRGETLEAIAGILDETEPAACARREAMEEAGLALARLERVAAVWTMPGISTERNHLFLAAFQPQDRVGPGGGVASEHEAITVHEMALADLAAMADAGELTDAKTLILVQTLRLRRPDLF